jgi:hypothetical protein
MLIGRRIGGGRQVEYGWGAPRLPMQGGWGMVSRRWLGVLMVLAVESPTTLGDGPRGAAQAPPIARGRPDIEIEVPGDDGFGELRASPDYKAAYRKARDEADASLKDGSARIFSCGMLGVSLIDAETGLAAMPISGCVIDYKILGRAEGNNERVFDWVKKHGPTSNSLLPWKKELSDLPIFFAAKAKAGATVLLRIGGPILTSPDGRYSLRQVATVVTRGLAPNHRQVTTLGLEVSERGLVRDTLADFWGDGLTDLAWGPAGAPFAVVKSRRKGSPDFNVLHLRPVDWVWPGGWLSERYLKELGKSH